MDLSGIGWDGNCTLSFGYDDGSERDEWEFGSPAEAAAFIEGHPGHFDCAERYSCEWMCLPTGGRERHKRRRCTLELEWVEGELAMIEELGSYGYEDFLADRDQ